MRPGIRLAVIRACCARDERLHSVPLQGSRCVTAAEHLFCSVLIEVSCWGKEQILRFLIGSRAVERFHLRLHYSLDSYSKLSHNKAQTCRDKEEIRRM